MRRWRPVQHEWMIFGGLLVAFALVLLIWFNTSPAAPGDFSK